MEALHATGFDGLLSLEIFNDQFRAGSARRVAVDGQRSLLYMLDQLRAIRPADSLPDVPSLPPRARCHGVEFIEFAIDEGTAVEFENFLAGLGFHKAGIHKSKMVTRWRQGDINLVVNCEKEGFAHSYNITHGSSVCAIGLKVEDAGATLDRAQKLLDRPFRQAVGPGELEIPAVRGLGGSLLYFVDSASELARVWEVEFEPVGGSSASADAGLTVVDHLSQSMDYGGDAQLASLLYLTARCHEDAAQDVIDPGGVVQSQVIQTQDGLLRIVLNASQSERTQSSRFIHEFFGSGVQHIALATQDIFATARALRSKGVKLLPIPENYYDDLEARIDLPPERIEQMKAGNILYDREGDAEYLQLYTQNFEDKFFFEDRRAAWSIGVSAPPTRISA